MGVRLAMVLVAASAVQAAPDPSPASEIPFMLHRGHLLLVRGNIGPLENLLLLLDTGAGRTILDTRVAASMGLEGKPTELDSFGSRVKGEEAMAPSIELGDYRSPERRVVVTDLSDTAGALGLPRLDGIVGIDVLKGRSFSLDYARHRLRFGPPAPVPYRVPFADHPVFLVISARLSHVQVKLIVDSGASHLVLFAHRAAWDRQPAILSSLPTWLGRHRFARCFSNGSRSGRGRRKESSRLLLRVPSEARRIPTDF